jgi:Chitobiase/beta-hexosaminidase C-terminal domain
MRRFLTCFTLAVVGACAQAQDPGMQAAQQAQIAAQIAQQANDEAMRDAQLASQNAMNAAQNATLNSQVYQCLAGTPRFSVKSGTYSAPVTVKILASPRSAVYYTTDGWTPTAASTRYTGPITIDATTTLQAIAFSSCNARSRVAAAVYTLNGVAAAPSAGQTLRVFHGAPIVLSNAAAAAAASGKLLLARGTAVPLVFASEVNSRTAHVGDKVSLTLAEDLKAGDTVVAKKGTTSLVTITEVNKPRMMGLPGEVVFVADSLQADGTVIKLRGTAAKEGQDENKKASALMVIPVPVGLLVHGKDAEIKQGAVFTAFVDADTLLPPN